MIQRFKNTNTLNNFGKVGLKILKHNRLNLRRTVLRGVSFFSFFFVLLIEKAHISLISSKIPTNLTN